MTDSWITDEMLKNAERLIDEAENIEGFGLQDVVDALLKLSGADDFINYYKVVMGDTQTSNEAIKSLSGKYVMNNVESAAEKAFTAGGTVAMKAGGKFAFKLLFILPDLTEIGMGVLTKYENIRDTVALGLEKKLMLDTFYAECSRRIAEASGDDGEWKISFAGPRGQGVTATHNFNMWGIGGLMSEWTLTGELVRQVTGAGDNYGGTYEGLLTLEIKGLDMAGSFDARFKDTEIFFNGGGGFVEGEKVLWNMQGMTNPTDEYKTTTLKRTVSGEFLVYVLEGSGVFTPTVLGSLTSAGDKTEFSFEHNINGNATFSSAGATINMVGSIKYTSSDITSYTFTSLNTANGIVLPEDSITRTVTPDIGTVWKPLESEPKFTLYLK
jgi:hypothetical protein